MQYTQNDEGNAKRFVTKYGANVRWVLGETGGQWRIFNGRKWVSTGADTFVRTAMRTSLQNAKDEEAGEYSTVPAAPNQKSDQDRFLKFIGDSLNSRPVENAVKMAQSFTELHAYSEDFDQQVRLLNFQNGTLDTATGVIREHRPEDMITRIMPCDFNPSAEAPVWKRFLETSMPDESVRLFLQVAMGYTLTGRSDQKILFYTYGVGDTGKSVFCNTMRRAFGTEYAATAPAGALRPRDKSGADANADIHKMRGKRFVTTSESRPGEPMDDALVKRLTGRDEQTTRDLYAKFESWYPEMAIWIASNQLPRMNANDETVFGRIKVVKFERQFKFGDPERDDQIEEKLKLELEGIVAWAFMGLQVFNAAGLRVPEKVAQWSIEFRDTADGVGEFLAEGRDEQFLTFEEGATNAKDDLYKMFHDWSTRVQMKDRKMVMGRNNFYNRLTAKGFDPDARDHTGKRVFGGLRIARHPQWSSAASWMPGNI